MSGDCQVHQQHLRRDGLSFEMTRTAAMAGPWLAAYRRDGTSVPVPGSTATAAGTADYWLRHRVDHQHNDPVAPAASCYFSRHQGKI